MLYDHTEEYFVQRLIVLIYIIKIIWNNYFTHL